MRISSTTLGLALFAGLPAFGLTVGLPGRPAGTPAVSADARPPYAFGDAARGCDILMLWHTYRGKIDYDRSQVRVKGSPYWSYLMGSRLDRAPAGLVPPSPEFTGDARTNGVVWNWKHELKQDRCDLDRRYRFKVVGLDETVTGRSNEPWVGVERWIYYPSGTGWTQRTRIDIGYLDLCIMDGTTCGKPYYPSGATPILPGQ